MHASMVQHPYGPLKLRRKVIWNSEQITIWNIKTNPLYLYCSVPGVKNSKQISKCLVGEMKSRRGLMGIHSNIVLTPISRPKKISNQRKCHRLPISPFPQSYCTIISAQFFPWKNVFSVSLDVSKIKMVQNTRCGQMQMKRPKAM